MICSQGKEIDVTNNCPGRADHAKSCLWDVPLLKGLVTGTEPKQLLDLRCLPPCRDGGQEDNTAARVLSSGSFAGKNGELGLAAEPDKRAAALVLCFYSRAWLVSPQRPGALLLKMNFKKTGIDVTLVWLAEEQHLENWEKTAELRIYLVTKALPGKDSIFLLIIKQGLAIHHTSGPLGNKGSLSPVEASLL